MTREEKYDALISKDVSPALKRARERKRNITMKQLLEQILSQFESDNIYPETQKQIRKVLEDDKAQSEKV